MSGVYDTSHMDLSNQNDEQLVAVIREKDQELYGEIIRRYKTKLTHYLRKFIYDADELEDVLQTVFIKSYQNLFGFNIEKKFSSWIYRIAHNEAINHLKKNSHRSIPFDEVEFKIVDDKIDLDGHIDRHLLKEKFGEYLNQLKLKYREPIILYYFEEKSYEEISDILRMPTSTVGTLIRRGKEQLKAKIENMGN